MTVTQIRCPKCGAQPHFACIAGRVKRTPVKKPHAERIAAAKKPDPKPFNRGGRSW